MGSNAETTPVWFITGCSTGLERALTERVLPGMRARARGHIVDISSVVGSIDQWEAATVSADFPALSARQS